MIIVLDLDPPNVAHAPSSRVFMRIQFLTPQRLPPPFQYETRPGSKDLDRFNTELDSVVKIRTVSIRIPTQ